jgi:hypothetical protein
MGPITSTLTKDEATGLRGTVIELSILDPGIGYTTGTNICTHTTSKFGADGHVPVTLDQSSLGCEKVDVLHVDITVDSYGAVLTAEPYYLKRGFFYNVGDTVAISKADEKYDNAILEITRIWPEN